MPFHKYLNAAKWKEYSFCGHFSFLGSVIQVAFGPANTEQRAKKDRFSEVATVVQHKGIEQRLCRGFFFQCKLPMETYQHVTVRRVFDDHNLSKRI